MRCDKESVCMHKFVDSQYKSHGCQAMCCSDREPKLERKVAHMTTQERVCKVLTHMMNGGRVDLFGTGHEWTIQGNRVGVVGRDYYNSEKETFLNCELNLADLIQTLADTTTEQIYKLLEAK